MNEVVTADLNKKTHTHFRAPLVGTFAPSPTSLSVISDNFKLKKKKKRTVRLMKIYR